VSYRRISQVEPNVYYSVEFSDKDMINTCIVHSTDYSVLLYTGS